MGAPEFTQVAGRAWLGCVLGWAASCALPSLQDSGKIRCVSDGDCLSGRRCEAGYCTSAHGDAGGGGDSPDDAGILCGAGCSGGQKCYLGLCTEVFATTPPCVPLDLDDGCPDDALCFEVSASETACRRFPACPSDGVCPVGDFGSVCNTGLINKSRICLAGVCIDASHCPGDWKCVFAFDADPAGSCSSGASGTPCRNNTDCSSNNCNGLLRVCA